MNRVISSRHFIRAIVFSSLLIPGLKTIAGATDPLDNWANPDGGYGVIYPMYYGANRITDKDGNTAVPDLDLHLYQAILRYVHYFNKDPRSSGLINVLLPVGRQELLGRRDSGIGDPTVTGGVWVVNDPKKHLYLAPGMDIDIPIGSYDKNNPASLGKNVWGFRPLLAFAKFTPPADLEITLKYNIATENPDTRIRPGNQFQFGSYLGVFVNPQWLLGGHFNYISGDDNRLSGTVIKDSGLEKAQIGPNALWLINNRWSAMLEILADVATRNTTEGVLVLSRIAYKL